MIGFMISQGFLLAQVYQPLMQPNQPSLNVPPGQWGQPSGVQPQRPGYSRNRGGVDPRSSSSSQFTRPQIYRFVDRIVSTAPNPQALQDLSYQVCRNNYRPIINSRRLTFEETVMFKERLGC
jgi:hypothetical protein